MTLRYNVSAEEAALLRACDEASLFILWHNRLFVAGDIARNYRRGKQHYSLISASGDGEWLAALFRMLGLGSVRGSSSRHGKEAAVRLLEKLREGCDVGITPDGPRGPVYKMKPGALVLARRSKARIILVGMDYHASWRLGSWDGFHIPKPFSRIDLRFVKFDLNDADEPETAARAMHERLVELNPDRIPTPIRRKASG
jgi:hypothetical protein